MAYEIDPKRLSVLDQQRDDVAADSRRLRARLVYLFSERDRLLELQRSGGLGGEHRMAEDVGISAVSSSLVSGAMSSSEGLTAIDEEIAEIEGLCAHLSTTQAELLALADTCRKFLEKTDG